MLCKGFSPTVWSKNLTCYLRCPLQTTSHSMQDVQKWSHHMSYNRYLEKLHLCRQSIWPLSYQPPTGRVHLRSSREWLTSTRGCDHPWLRRPWENTDDFASPATTGTKKVQDCAWGWIHGLDFIGLPTVCRMIINTYKYLRYKYYIYFKVQQIKSKIQTDILLQFFTHTILSKSIFEISMIYILPSH